MATRITPADHTLWRDVPATGNQLRLFDQAQPPKKPPQRHGRITQADLILSLLRAARARGTPLSLPEILGLGVAQYSARLKELRDAGHVIQNRLKRIDGVTHSWYELVHDVEHDEAER
jgi:hypothetical protein